MTRLRTHLLGTVVALMLLGLGGGLLTAHRTAKLAAAESIATVACLPASGNWTDCTITLNQSLSAGGAVVASLPSATGALSYCDDGLPLNTLCGLSGNGAIFSCPSGCAVGTQFVASVVSTNTPLSADSLALQITITATGMGPAGRDG